MKRWNGSRLFYDICEQPYSNLSRIKLYNSSKESKELLQRMRLLKSLPYHTGCVNSICWSESGELLLSGSDDQRLIVTHGHTYKILSDVKTVHRANIFSAKFLPGGGDNRIVSCAGDGTILYTDLEYPSETSNSVFSCHAGTVYDVATLPTEPHSFLSCGEDGTVRWFDLRQKTGCVKQDCREDVLISCRRAATTIAVNHTASWQLAVGCSDSRVRVFDRRMLTTGDSGEDTACVSSHTVPGLKDRSYRITSLCFSPEGEQLLASYSSDHLYLFTLKDDEASRLDSGATTKDSVATCKTGRVGMSERPAPPAAAAMRRLRLRGDWSDTGPNARPEGESEREGETSQVTQHATLMQRMTDVLSRMLNDPATRAALNNNNDDTSTPEDTSNGPEEPLIVPSASSTPQLSTRDDEMTSSVAGEGSSSTVMSEDPINRNVETPGVSSNSAMVGTESDEDAPMEESSTARDETLCESCHQARTSTAATPVSDREPVAAQAGTPQAHSASSPARALFQRVLDNVANRQQVNALRLVSQSTQTLAGVGRNIQQPQAMSSGEESDEDSWYSYRGGCVRDERPASTCISQTYTGHRNARTMIKEACFWGSGHVMSGSDCGHVFVWDRWSSRLVALLPADQHVVNCLRPHPSLPLLATAGIDHDVKLWAPLAERGEFDEDFARDLMRRNEVMLEETRDTITVPASFMIRMLACLNQLRRGGRPRGSDREETQE